MWELWTQNATLGTLMEGRSSSVYSRKDLKGRVRQSLLRIVLLPRSRWRLQEMFLVGLANPIVCIVAQSWPVPVPTAPMSC